jgi:NDP-sugar pyrophosphorylase family protein
MTLPLAILAGGLATRLLPITNDIPKSMIKIKGRPFIDWQLELVANSGIKKVVLCVSHRSEMIKNHVGNGSNYNLEVLYSHDGARQMGTGGAIIEALPMLGSEFMVMYGDSYLAIDYEKISSVFLALNIPGLLTVFRNENRYDKSNILFDGDLIQEYSKNNPKPNYHYIDYGLSCFKASVFNSNLSQDPIDLADFYTQLSVQGRLGGYEVKNRFYEIGSVEGIKDFSYFIERNRSVV